MKRFLMLAGVAALIGAGLAFVQRPQILIDPAITLALNNGRANSASTGTAVDLAGYASATMQAVTGQSDIATSAVVYIVLQDSTPGSATWNAVDSIAVDSTDNAIGAKNGVGSLAYQLSYQGTRRWVRALQRASGNAADTVGSLVVILRGNKRAR